MPRPLAMESSVTKAKEVLTRFTRLAQRSAKGRDVLRRLLSENLEGLFQDAIDVAVETGDPIGTILAEVVAKSPRPSLASSVLENLPRIAPLQELGVELAKQVLTSLQEASVLTLPEGWAAAHEELARRLLGAGRNREAIKQANAAIGIYSLPTIGWRKKNKIQLLHSVLGEAHRNIGDTPAALREVDSALALFPSGSVATDDPFRAGLLHDRACMLFEMRMYEEARASVEEAIQYFSDMTGPGTGIQGSLEVVLGMALNTHSMILTELGQHDRALAVGLESERTLSQLYHSDAMQYAKEYLICLSNLVVRYQNVENIQDAFQTAEQAVRIAEQLAAARPLAFDHFLARALNNRARCQLERRELADDDLSRSALMWDQIAAREPHAFTGERITTKLNLAQRLVFQEPDKAIQLSREALAELEALAQAVPSRWEDQLHSARLQHVRFLETCGRTKEAHRYASEAGLVLESAEGSPTRQGTRSPPEQQDGTLQKQDTLADPRKAAGLLAAPASETNWQSAMDALMVSLEARDAGLALAQARRASDIAGWHDSAPEVSILVGFNEFLQLMKMGKNPEAVQFATRLRADVQSALVLPSAAAPRPADLGAMPKLEVVLVLVASLTFHNLGQMGASEERRCWLDTLGDVLHRVSPESVCVGAARNHLIVAREIAEVGRPDLSERLLELYFTKCLSGETMLQEQELVDAAALSSEILAKNI
jgi:tetratricopeptide (TPR) repeat protein